MFFLKFFIEHDSELLEIEGTSVADFFAENQSETAAEVSSGIRHPGRFPTVFPRKSTVFFKKIRTPLEKNARFLFPPNPI